MRLQALKQQEMSQDTDIVKVIREKRTSLLLSQLLLASIQKKMAQKFNIQPGEDMITAIARAEEIGAQIIPADREIRISLLRTWRMLRFTSKVKVLPEILLSLFVPEDITEEDVERLKEQDALELAMRTIAEKLPEVKTTLIDERDQYLAHQIVNVPGKRIVAVLGAGHVAGVISHMEEQIDIAPLLEIPPPNRWVRLAGWIFPLIVIGLFVAGFYSSGAKASMNMIVGWSAVTASFSGLGAIILLSHPLTIIASAVSAPIATLHPLIATGWVAALTEATVRKPKVADFLNLPQDITSLRGFLRNKITRVLLVFNVVNLTTSIGVAVGLAKIVRFF